MPIPFATTTITVTRIETSSASTDLIDPYDAVQPAPTTVASGVRATIGPPSATTELAGGRRVEYDVRFASDVTDLEPGDTVTDATGNVWRLIWAQRVAALGSDHMVGLLRATTGAT